MGKFIDLTGAQYERLTVLRRGANRGVTRAVTMWVCQCTCGNVCEVQSTHWTSRRRSSCGCYTKVLKHGLSSHPLYPTWNLMMTRCYNEKHEYFYRYGGRGISVTQDWHDCKKFVVEIESLLGPKPPGLQMDRIENDGNYDKKNIRWATRIENCRNRHDNMQTVYKGTPMLLLEAAELSGIHVTVLRQRVRAKRPMERLFDPVRVPYHI